MLLICVIVVVVSFDHTAATAHCDAPVCPGDTVSCECTSEAAHAWRGTAFSGQCSQEELIVSILISPIDEVGESITCGIFTATVIRRGTNKISSELTFVSSPDLNGTTVACYSIEDSDINTIIFHGPEQTIIQQAHEIQDGENPGPTSRDVTLRWTVPDPSEISRYIISCTADPPDPQCDRDIVLPAGGAQVREHTTATLLSVEYVFVAGLDVEYSITVRTDNCGDRQNGSESEPLTLALRVPSAVEGLHLSPVYDNSSGHLLAVNIMWDKVPKPVVRGVEGMAGRVLYYILTVAVHSIPETRVYSSLECVGDRCSYAFDATGLIPTSQVNVSVAAVNGIGSGLANQPLSVVFSNNLLAVSMEVGDDKAAGWRVTCSFLSAFPGSDATCRIDYGTDSSYTNLPYSDESTETGGANDSVSIWLQRLNSTTTYYYRVSAIESGDHTITVQGSFIITGVFKCSLSDLTVSTSELPPTPDSRCGEEANTIPIPNGEVCYTSTTPYSTAVYYCNSGHRLEGGTVRVCQANGLWSGEASTCIPNSGLTTATAVAITSIIMFTFILSVLLLGTLIYHCLKRKGRNRGSHSQSPEPIPDVGPVYEEVIPGADNRRESFELSGNIAYGPTAIRKQ